MRKLLILLLLLPGCGATPYIEGGFGYSVESFDITFLDNGKRVPFDETGVYGTYGAGIEFQAEKWYSPSECGYYHRSMADPSLRFEFVFNDIGCKKRIRFGGNR